MPIVHFANKGEGSPPTETPCPAHRKMQGLHMNPDVASLSDRLSPPHLVRVTHIQCTDGATLQTYQLTEHITLLGLPTRSCTNHVYSQTHYNHTPPVRQHARLGIVVSSHTEHVTTILSRRWTWTSWGSKVRLFVLCIS